MLADSTSTARSSWSAVRSALVADVLRERGHLRLRVRGKIRGESMLPTLWPGDVVEIEACSLEDVRPGEIVLALREDCLVLHRLVAPCTPNGFLLRGDSVPAPDPSFPPEALLGRLVSIANQRQPVSGPTRRAGFSATAFGVKWSRAAGMLLCQCGVARRLALKLRLIWKASPHEFQSPEQVAELGAL